MRMMFVYYCFADAGSAQDIYHYARAASHLGHEVAVYGPSDPASPFKLSMDVDSADVLIFVFEWTTHPRGDQLDVARLLKVPRHRRIVIDCDGAYNDAISVHGDYNHRGNAESRTWTEVCDSISDRIFQPTLHPRRANVRPFLFHGYSPQWEQPLDLSCKEFGMVYVGHSKFRWHAMQRVLQAVRPLLDEVGRIAVVGHGWDAMPAWAGQMGIEDFYYTDPDYLRELGIEIVQPVTFEQVIPWMSRAFFNPVIYRPIFRHLSLVTCRTFETPAAGTLPLFDLDENYVAEIFGSSAVELVIPQHHPEEKIGDMMRRPEHYAGIVLEIRRHLAEHHSYGARLQQLVEIVRD